jgi:hypothetical protein
MSPAEAAFMAINLAMLKLVRPEYQVPPEQWEQDTNEIVARHKKESGGKSHKSATAQLNGRLLPKEIGEVFKTIERDVADENSELVRYSHLLLDRIGFAR